MDGVSQVAAEDALRLFQSRDLDAIEGAGASWAADDGGPLTRLVEEFPEFLEAAPEVFGVARQYAASVGRVKWGYEPWFWRLVYLAGCAPPPATEG